MKKHVKQWAYWWQDRFAAALIGLGKLLPYSTYMAIVGWFGAYVIGPLAGLPKLIRKNLALTMPDLTEPEVARLCKQVPASMARTIAEIFSGDRFIDHVKDTPLHGAGWPALQQARDTGQPVVLVTAHLGNYDAARVALRANGCTVAAIYKPMRNAAFNARYVPAIEKIGTPIFPNNRAGVLFLVKHLRKGGIIALLADNYVKSGALIDFMGQPAYTAVSSAEMALKYNALLIPIYAIRKDDGISFDIQVEAPIAHTDPVTMTREINQSIEAVVKAHPDQWMWSHQRWKDNQPR